MDVIEGRRNVKKNVTLFGQNTQCPRVAPLTRERRAPLNPVLVIIIARSLRVNRCQHRLRSSQQTGAKFVVQNPKRGEGAAVIRVSRHAFYPLRENQRCLARSQFEEFADRRNRRRPFRRLARFVLTGQDPRQRRIRDNTHPVISASRQHLDFVAPIHCVLIWLADHGFRDAHLLAEALNFGHSQDL